MRRSRTRRGLVACLAVVIAVPLTAATPALAGPWTPDQPGDPAPLRTEKPAPGKTLAALPVKPDPVAEGQIRGNATVTWPVPGVSDVDLSPAATRVQAGEEMVKAGAAPVWLGRAKTGGEAGAPVAPTQVRVDVLEPKQAQLAGVPGLAMAITRTDGRKTPGPVPLKLDYSGFRDAFGGDWASRLRIVSLPACAATTPDKPECRVQTPLRSKNDTKTNTVTAQSMVSADAGVLAVAAGNSGPAGDWAATPLADAAKWQVSTQSGSFGWSYPFRVPPVPGSLTPTIGLAYGSGAVDGRTAAQNNQASWAGEGFDLWPGQISWRFKPCSQDTANGSPQTGDQCWAGDYASMVFNGRASDLIKVSDTVWKPTVDDGTRIEQLGGIDNGDHGGQYWRVTTTDGTQYFFGSKPETNSTWTVPVFGNDPNEPCKAATFDGSWCKQAWRWQMDHVVDKRGNTMTYHYVKENNKYALNIGKSTEEYTRGGWLARIDYGTRTGSTDSAPAWVEFETGERCLPGSDCAKTSTAQPDVPWDRNCDAGPCIDRISPTFWTTKRLSKIITKIRENGVEKPVDSWTLEHMFPNPGDNTKPALWLNKITHTGLGGTATPEPPTEFRGTAYPNRINTPEDGQPPLNKYRLTAIYNPTGGVTQVAWEDPDCKSDPSRLAHTNTQRCFPVHWSPEQGEPVKDWFHKYVVRQVVLTDRVGGAPAQVTSYDYFDGGAWRYNDDPLIPADRRTWSQWRGYGKVAVRTGDPGADPGTVEGRTEYVYYRGMYGDRKLPDDNQAIKTPQVVDSQGGKVDDLAGFEGTARETIVYNGVGKPEVSGTIVTPVRRETARKDSRVAYLVRPERTDTRTALAGGGTRRGAVVNSYNDEGIITQVEDFGDTAADKTNDDRCTKYEYARNVADWVLTLPSRVHTFGTTCKGTPSYPKDSISDIQTVYDEGALGAPPTTGTWIRSKQVSGYNGSTPVHTTDSRTKYDAYGRVEESYDALDRLVKTTYTTTTGLTTGKTETTPLNQPVKTTVDPRWGTTTSTEDVNGRKTEAEYDALGRLTSVWYPGRSKEIDGPHTRFRYTVRADGASAVTTDTLKANDNYTSSHTLYDGFLRKRQTQQPAWMIDGQKGRILTDTEYDSRGRVVRKNSAYSANGDAGVNLFKVDAVTDVPAQTVQTYDGAGRGVKTTLVSAGVPQWQTTTEHRGDAVTVTPPRGGTTTTSVLNARGEVTEVRQHKEASATSAYDNTKYTLTKAGQPESLTDSAGNVWTYQYDVRGRLTGINDPDKGPSTMTYDDAGQMLTKTDARNQVILFDYDAGGRTKAIYKDEKKATNKLAEWTYDPAGALGKLNKSTRYVDGKEYTFTVTGYDDAYRPTASEIKIPSSADPFENKLAGTYTSTATYRADGSLVHETLPKLGNLPSEQLTYKFDNFGMPYALTGNEEYVGYTRYTPFYETEMTRFGPEKSEMWEQQDYDRITRQMSQIRVQHRKSTEIQAESTLSYDPSGNLTKLTNARPSEAKDVQCFGYDYLRRLTEAWTSTSECSGTAGTNVGGPESYWTTFGYDAIGNRLSEKQNTTNTLRTTKYPNPGQPRPHSPVSTTAGGTTKSYDYNAIGATTSRPTSIGSAQALTWNAEGQLASAGTSSYIYDVEGKRLITKDDKGATLHLASGDVRYDKASETLTGTRNYVHNGTRVAVRTGTKRSDVSYVLQDQHGTDTVAVNAESLQVARRRLDAFGQPRGQQPAAWPGTKGFVGGSTEASTGLTHIGARSYDPATGKFISVDPLLSPAEPQTFNAYSYAGNNPTSYSDSTGLARDKGDNTDCPPGTSSCWAAPPPPPAPPAPTPRSSDNTRCPPNATTANCNSGKSAGVPAKPKSQPLVPVDECSGPFKPWKCYSKKELNDYACGLGYGKNNVFAPIRFDKGCEDYDKQKRDEKKDFERENRKNQQLAKQSKEAEAAAKQASRTDSSMDCRTISLFFVAIEGCYGTDKHGSFEATSYKALPLSVGWSFGLKVAPGDRNDVAGRAIYTDAGLLLAEVGYSMNIKDEDGSIDRELGPSIGGGGGFTLGIMPVVVGIEYTEVRPR